MIFFSDENFIRQANALLRAFDPRNEYVALLDRLPRGTSDVDWLREVGAWDPKPVIVCGDGRVLTNRVERAALRATGCVFVHLAPGWTNTAWHPYAVALLKCWPDVLEMVERTKKPAIIDVTVRGKVSRRAL